MNRKELKEWALEVLKDYGDRVDSYYEKAVKSSRISTLKLGRIKIESIGRESYDMLECVVDHDYAKLDRYFETI